MEVALTLLALVPVCTVWSYKRSLHCRFVTIENEVFHLTWMAPSQLPQAHETPSHGGGINFIHFWI